MHHITFKVVSTDEWFGDAIDIAIDGANLIDLVREYELPMATAEGSPDIAGGYMGIPASSHLPPSQHFLGHDSPGLENAKSDIFWCRDCGEPGCWPLRARITRDADIITWSHFEQPHRTTDDKSARWAYNGFGPFTFDQSQYEEALNNAATTPP